MKKAYTDAVVRRFERAVDSYAFRGTIPYGESEAAAEAYDAVCTEYARAKRSLLVMIDKLNSQPRKGKP